MIKFAIVGCGRIGERHAKHINNVGKLVAIADIDIYKTQKLVNQYQVPAYSSLDDLLNSGVEIDVLAVCTPNGLHAEHSIKALKAGCHVLCEKPMALSVHDCGEMIQAAEKANRRLFIVKQNRYNPPVVKVKELIENGSLGKIQSVHLSCVWNRNEGYYKNTWKGSKGLDGGILYTQFSHFIDLIYWLVGDVRQVKSFTKNTSQRTDIEFEDTSVVACEFYNGAIGTMHFTINSHKKNMEGAITLMAEKGTIKIGGQYLNELEYQNIDGLDSIEVEVGNPVNNYGDYQGSMSNHDKVYQNVVDVLRKGDVIATNGFEGLKTIEIIDKIYSLN